MLLTTLPLPLLSLLLSLHPTTSTLIYSTYTSTVTSLPTSSPPPSSSSSPTFTSPTLFISTLLNSTNTYRNLTSAPPLTWNTTLATYASSYASHCLFKHSGGPYGENLAEGYADVGSAVGGWGGEGRGYKVGEGFSERTGHWTQLVWKGTMSVGCGAVDCDGVSGGNATGWYLVCEYYPPGNVEGEYTQNVGRVKYQIVSGSGDAREVANSLVNAAEGRWTGMKMWNWGIVGGFVVMGLVV